MTEDEIWKWRRDASFFVRTVTFDVASTGFGTVISSGYAAAQVALWLDFANSTTWNTLN